MITDVSLGGISLTGVSYGVDWGVTKIEGWGSPAGNINVVQKPRGNGGWAGDQYLTPRSVVLSGTAYSDDVTVTGTAADALMAATTLATTTLSVTESGLVRQLNVRRDGPVIITWPNDAGFTFDWSVQLVAVDPRKFGTTLSASTLLPVVSGGLTVPFTVPFSINSTIVNGQVNLTNPGNTAGPVTLRIDGPVTGPIVTHVSTGRALVFASSLVLGAGEFITVDMERREVLANGQSSRNGWVTSRGWSQFEPGDNTWSFTAVAYDPASMLTVAASPTWQ